MRTSGRRRAGVLLVAGVGLTACTAGELHPALVVTGSSVVEVTLGDPEVSAGQDRVFTSVPTAVGWQLADAESDGNVNWALALS